MTLKCNSVTVTHDELIRLAIDLLRDGNNRSAAIKAIVNCAYDQDWGGYKGSKQECVEIVTSAVKEAGQANHQ